MKRSFSINLQPVQSRRKTFDLGRQHGAVSLTSIQEFAHALQSVTQNRIIVDSCGSRHADQRDKKAGEQHGGRDKTSEPSTK
jgi:hypothetical protein